MYFDYDYWWRVVRHVWGLRGWDGRTRMLLRLLLVVPLVSLFHGLCFMLDYLLFWRLWSQRVEQPVFIVGHGRSGTTLMHRLMSADGERFSYFLYWEMFFPSLLQKKIIRGLGWIDAKLLRGFVHNRLKIWDDKKFGPYRHMHYMSLWSAEEDCFAMGSAFVTQQWSLEIPMMDVVDFFHLDQMADKRRRWMGHYRQLVKRQLLLNGGDKVHLSKNPLMSGWVDSIIEEFPDARIVVMMRDPAECIPSCLKLVEHSWKGKGWQPADYERSLALLTEVSFDTFDNPKAVLAAHPETPQTVVDYRELTSAPRETLLAVYQALGMTVTDEFDHWLRQQAEREKKHNSKFEYSLGDFRLSREEIRQRLDDFYEVYQWKSDPYNDEVKESES
ncbi:sulfotransferase [Seongchinamella sediminis]|uniref:Sulfotransferase n=1 Tax=Seongchinamella sediminis TaxID=2283635 RepID=A0A3L7E3L6_9GAMM|nr:sulfotransferase [Seongchinamella sediminis]RLQ22912.1 sulfotransferase [Seongchinamella sediminis]